ncbi:MAG TPA: glycosyltransferase [Candidatus Dormibacteraeota bacterium]|nr:glycosyltransferase [Candidatus Dormibacteraeota bacterium]
MHTSPTASLGQNANGGMNVYIREIAAAFSRCGIATDVFTLRAGADDPEIERFAPLSRVIYLPVGHDHADKYELEHHVEEFAQLILAFQEADQVDYQLVYSHYWLSGMVAGVLRERLCAPWAHTAHTLALVKNRHLAPGATPEPAARVLAERAIAQSANLLIASTSAEADDLARLYGTDPDRIAVVAPGIDLGTFSPMRKADAKRKVGYPGERLLLFVGRLERLKGVETILRAFPLAADRRHQDVRLLILGEDSHEGGESEKERLRELAGELGIAAQVDFLGSVAHHELPYFYGAAEACLMPSYTESFGLVGLEAQACGCAVVASNVAGLASVVRDGVTGYLVDGHEAAEWADRLGRILDDPELAEQMGRRGVLLAQRFPWGLAADRIWATLEPILTTSTQQVAHPS